MNNNYIFPFLWMRGEPEEVIREEIGKIAECGIRAVCVEARPHKDFCGPGWWHDMDIVLDEAKKRDMKIWILDDKHFPTGYANGLIEQHPERKKQYIACTTVDIYGASRPLSLNIQRMLKPTIGFWEIGNPVDYAEQARNTLVCAAALRYEEGHAFHEDVVDLTDQCRDGKVSFTLPEGQWRIHVVYRTRTDGGDPTYINMIDKVSAHTQIEGVYEAHYERYASEFGKTIAGFFSDEPQFGNISEQSFDTKLGKKKMPLPWSEELEQMLADRYGAKYRALLPFLFAESVEKESQPQIRYDYMDCISKLYAQNFARPIGQWCKEHGVEYIGHVVEDNSVHSRLGLGAAHWFRAMEGQDMAGIDVIGGQYYFGAPVQERKLMAEGDGEFFHYALGKMGASGGHLDPKKKGRTMCELFGAYGWGFGVRDMKHLLDHLLVRGINHLVPHAFSMAEFPDPDCPPHFYARGNNPEFPYFAQLMKYANRMCDRLNGGEHIASAAVLYDGELDWTGERMPMQKICRALTENQIDFDIVCLDMLRNLPAYKGSLSGGKLVINGVTFDALLVPGADYVPEGLVQFAASAGSFQVWFAGRRPLGILSDESGKAEDPGALDGIPVVDCGSLAAELEEIGARKIRLLPAAPYVTVYHYRRDGQILMLMNESAEAVFEGTLELRSRNGFAYYDAFADRYEEAECTVKEGVAKIRIRLQPGESCLLMEKSGGFEVQCVHEDPGEKIAQCGTYADLSQDWEVQRAKAGKDARWGEWKHVKELTPISDEDPDFSGTIRYRKKLTLAEKPAEAYLSAAQVYEVMRVMINGSEAGTVLAPPYQVSIGQLLKAGENTLEIEVATTPARDAASYPQPPFDFFHEALEPTGMFGKIELYTK
ncbi:MAG: glycoside hydrolase family 2 [Lachnospiraceae bacterium]|nr:glycoside hydrolase family 2 [Lachnospiraceae bacterium]